jgi:tetratricopeptide (TPR) repeat protein
MLVVLLVGVLACSGAVYGLWRYQVERKAGTLVEQADKAKAEGKAREEEQYLRNYLSVRPDDREVEIRWANLWAEIGGNEMNLDDWTGKDYMAGRGVMEATLRKYDDEDKLRRRLVDLSLKAGLIKEALNHIDTLLNRNPKDAELLRMRALCMFQMANPKALDNAYKLIGYDPAADVFDVSKATAPGEAAVYRITAQNLRTNERRPELADRVMNQLVEVNPGKVEAYLQRAEYRRGLEENDTAKEDLKKAYELDPNSADVLSANVAMQLFDLQEKFQETVKADPKAALTDDDIAACRALVEAGNAAHPDDVRFYQYLAQLELYKKDYQKGLEHLERGSAKVDERRRMSTSGGASNCSISRPRCNLASRISPVPARPPKRSAKTRATTSAPTTSRRVACWPKNGGSKP